ADARAALEAAQTRLADTRIASPAAGVVLARKVEPGDAVQPGVPLLVVAREGARELVIEPDEKNLGMLALGQHAVASADAFPERRFDAEVAWIAPAVDPRRGTIEVRLTVPRPDDTLKPDMTVSVEVEVARVAEALTVPRAAVRDLAGAKPWALVVVDGHAARRELTLGLRGDAALEVRAGLAADDRIILPERGGPEPGAKVRLGETGGG
ncbi:MAG: efflux RND transporter periplasmic adaptor subunit, partial [Deltaproteobacteria bacterium]